MTEVRARLRVSFPTCVVEIQRAKYKHWFRFGTHKDTDTAFRRAISEGSVQWSKKIIDEESLF